MSDYKECGKGVPDWGVWEPCGCSRCSPPEHKARKNAGRKLFVKKMMKRARRRISKRVIENEET